MSTPTDIYDPNFVKGVFDRCSERYIAVSYICSFGFTERWRKQCVANMPIPGASAPAGYDLMAGTGEVWPHLLKRLPATASITAVDISTGMHKRAIDRLHKHRAHKIDFIEDDVLVSKLPQNSADFVISTFGIKTFTARQHAQLAKLVASILKPGGVFSIVEASDPKGWPLRPVYLFHLKVLLPLVERFLMRGAQDFAMLGTYSTNFGDARAFGDMLAANGLDVQFKKYFFGCATGIIGQKPQSSP